MNGVSNEKVPHPDGRGWLVEVDGTWYEVHALSPAYAARLGVPPATMPASPAKPRRGLTMIRGGVS